MTLTADPHPRRTGTRAAASAEFDPSPYVTGLGALLAGVANVVMQLGLAPVGYGVMESRVESGQITRHPLKRFRTTFTYLAVALLGDELDRSRYRRAVNGVHRHVHSDASSPVAYNAFDADLQLWVAACLYWGSEDLYTRMHGSADPALTEQFYRFAARLGTTLQVPPELWPADRAAFERYWQQGLQRVSIDPPVRAYLRGLIDLTYLPRPVQLLFARPGRWITAGFLPDPLRAQLGLRWSARDEARFARLLRLVGAVDSALPQVIRMVPFNVYLWDTRRRARRGIALI